MVHINHSKKSCQMTFMRLSCLTKQYLVIIHNKYYVRRCRLLVTVLLTFTIFYMYTTYDRWKTNENEYRESLPTHVWDLNTSSYIPVSNFNQQSYRTVLLWTDLFSNIYWHQERFFNVSTIVACSSKYQCRFTRDKRKLSQSSIVAFHLYDINRHRLPERIPLKYPNQSWVFITGESPINFYYQNPSYYPHLLDDYFDRSISYKHDSPFSIFSPILKSRTLSEQTVNPPPVNTNERHLNNISLKYKKKPIAWIVSNCVTFSQREKYVKELQKFIPVDIYGDCGRSCSDEVNHQCKIDLHEYYFYLSFENSRCHSYITEKFWNIILDNTHRLVPIVMGATDEDYERIAPKQSYIHVNNFKTPEDLAKYLHDLMSNPEQYLAYLQWREHTKIEAISPARWMTLLCPLCQMAYETELSSHSRINFSTWYSPKTECHRSDVQILSQCKQVNLKDWMSWTHNIKCP